jgi:integrase
MRILTLEEEQRLLACCSATLKPLVLTALHTGFRTSELLSLTWAAVDFRRHSITVRAAYVKNGESRSVPMNAVLRSTLQACRMTANAAETPVFRTPRGTPYKNFRTAFECAVAQAGIADFTFHDLRHTFASRLVMAGVNLPTVQALMGHKTIAMTLRYTHLTTEHKHRAVRLLEPVADKVPANFTTVSHIRGKAVS